MKVCSNFLLHLWYHVWYETLVATCTAVHSTFHIENSFQAVGGTQYNVGGPDVISIAPYTGVKSGCRLPSRLYENEEI